MSDGITANQLQPGVVTVLSQTVTLTAAEVRALPSTAIEIIEAPGANKAIFPIAAWWYVKWAADFGNIGDISRIGIGYTAALSSALTQFSEATGNQVSNLLADGASHPAVMGILGVCPAAASAVVLVGMGQIQDDPGATNTALEIYGVNDGSHTGDFTGGIGTVINVNVLYIIMDIPS